MKYTRLGNVKPSSKVAIREAVGLSLVWNLKVILAESC